MSTPEGLFPRGHVYALAAFAVSALLSTPVSAQRDTVRTVPSVPWVTHRNMVAAGAAAGATLFLLPFDKPISSEFAEPMWARGRPDRRVADRIARLGGSGPLLASSAFYLYSSRGAGPPPCG
jgi:hypothetical protein